MARLVSADRIVNMIETTEEAFKSQYDENCQFNLETLIHLLDKVAEFVNANSVEIKD